MADLAVLIVFPLGCLAAFFIPSFHLRVFEALTVLHARLSKVAWAIHLEQLKSACALVLRQSLATSILLSRHYQAVCSRIWNGNGSDKATQKRIQHIKGLAEFHETAAVLSELIQKDGAGSWPPQANYEESTWPEAIQPYNQILREMSPLLATPQPSLDDEANRLRIADFRSRFGQLLREKVNLKDVRRLLDAADAGRWDVFPRDTFNAFYCCISMSRHAYRWGTIPVVKVAQLEQVANLPAELVEPWTCLQRLFGCTSESGNNTSCLVLNCDDKGKEVYQINVGLSERIRSSEEAFVRILHDVEVLGLPIYHDMISAIISFSRNDRKTCAECMTRINHQLRPLFGSYYSRVHDNVIAISAWLSHVQGFFAWGAGYMKEDGTWVKFDGLSGNQSLLFQALDAFLGIEPYLSEEDMERNVPSRQRKLCEVIRKHSFRAQLVEQQQDETDAKIILAFDEILKRLRLFRSAHRTRALNYLSQPAPERLPMTAGKSLLKSDIEQSLDFLDGFMVKRLKQTI